MDTMFWLRPPVSSGRFYPREPDRLKSLLDEFCPETKEKTPAIAIMVPHAGYLYSGQIAGDVYKKIKVPEYAIILCPNHTGKGPKISVWSEGAWDTPLGRVAIGEDLAKKLLAGLSLNDGDMSGHTHEHGVEVHVPFLQHVRKDIKIVPIVVGHLRPDQCLKVGENLAKVIEAFGKEKVLLVASSDMSHYIPADVAFIQDGKALVHVKALDPEGLYKTVAENEISMCGVVPTTIVLEAAKRLGAKEAELVSYGNSAGDVGDLADVVGYANAIIR